MSWVEKFINNPIGASSDLIIDVATLGQLQGQARDDVRAVLNAGTVAVIGSLAASTAGAWGASPGVVQAIKSTSVLYALGMAQQGLDRGQAEAGDPIRGHALNISSNVAQLPVVYGNQRVGGARVMCEVHGATNEYLDLVIAICEGEIAGIPAIYVNDVLITDAKYAGLITYQTFMGTDSQAASSQLLTNIPTKWTTDHKGSGVAYIALTFKYDSNVFGGLPQVTFDVLGKLVYDPRTSTTAYSNNPALCIRDYLTNARYGKGLGSAQIDASSFIAAANYCDDYVGIPGGTQPRYTCDGAVNVNSSALDNIRGLLTSCRAQLVYSHGVYKLLPDQAGSAGFAFTEDNIIGGWSINQPGRRSKFNRVTADFVNQNKAWQPDLGIADSPAYRTQDAGLLLETKIDLPFTSDIYRAQQLAGLHLKLSRFGISAEFTAMQEAMRCEVGDVVSITHSTTGWVGKLFRVTQITLLDTEEVEVVVQEYDATAYNLDTLTAITSTPTANLPDPFAVALPTGVTVVSVGQEIVSGDGTIVSRIKVSWAQPADAFVTSVQVQYKRTADSAWTDLPEAQPASLSSYVSPVGGGVSYDVRLRNVNSMGYKSGYVLVSGHTVVGSSAIPPDVAAFTGTASTLDGSTKLAWTRCTDPAYSYTEIREGASWVAGTLVCTIDGSSYSVLYSGSVTTTDYWAKHVNVVGNKSANAATANVTTVAPTALAGTKVATARLYQWSPTAPSAPNGTSTYTWASGASSGYTGSLGWDTVIGSNPGTPGLQLWVATLQVVASNTDTTSTVNWAGGGASVNAWSQNGAAGVQSAKAVVYQWAATIPSGPVGSPTYTWATSSFGAAPSSWSLTPGTSPSAGFTLWAAEVNLVDSAANTTTNFTWSSAGINARGYAGTSGTAGASYRTAYLASTTGSPTTYPNPKYDYADTATPGAETWGLGGYWSTTVPTLSSGQYMYQSDGIYNPGTGATTWSIPYWSSLKVGSLSAISANMGTLTSGEIIVGSSPAVSGSSMSGYGTHLYGDGRFVMGTPSRNIGYNGSDLFLNGIMPNLSASSNYTSVYSGGGTSVWGSVYGGEIYLGSVTAKNGVVRYSATVTIRIYSLSSGTIQKAIFANARITNGSGYLVAQEATTLVSPPAQYNYMQFSLSGVFTTYPGGTVNLYLGYDVAMRQDSWSGASIVGIGYVDISTMTNAQEVLV